VNVPGLPSLFFLAYLLLLLPWLAFRSARRLRGGAASMPAREAIWISTLISQTILLLLAWLVGRGFDYAMFAMPRVETKYFGAAILAFAICLGLRWLSRAIRSADERRKLAVYAWAPRSRREWILWTIVVLIGSIAEEAAYRGVGMQILWYSLGSPWPAVLILSIAFAVAHATQGAKSAVVIFAVALVMHALVAYTGTLIFAIVVHAIYDLITGIAISRTARQYDHEVVAQP
jgi:membrane protease YdiL (CAAX protease family)